MHRYHDWLPLVACLMSLVVGVLGMLFQSPVPGSRDFTWLDTFCWVNPCSIDREPMWPWERHGAVRGSVVSKPLWSSLDGVAIIDNEHAIRFGWTGEGQRKPRLPLPTSSRVTAVALGPRDTILTASEDGEVFEWTGEGQQKRRLPLPTSSQVTAVALGPRDTILTVNEDGEVFQWTREGQQKRRLPLPTSSGVTAVALGPSGRIVTGDEAGGVSEWTAEGKRTRLVRSPIGSRILAVALGQEGTIAAANANGQVFEWRSESGPVRRLRVPVSSRVTALASRPDGTIVTANEDGQVFEWRGEPGPVRRLRVPVSSRVTALASRPDGTIVAATGDGQVFEWRGEPGPVRRLRVPVSSRVTALASRPDGTIVVATERGLFESHNESRLFRPLRFPTSSPVTALASRPDGTIVVATERGLFESHSESRLFRPLRFPTSSPVTALASRLDGTIVVATERGLFESHSESRLFRPLRFPTSSPVTALAPRPDGTIVVATEGGDLFESRSAGRLYHLLPFSSHHRPTAAGLRFNYPFVPLLSEGRILLERSDGEEPQPLHLPTLPDLSAVTTVTLGPDRTVVTGHQDGTVLQLTSTGQLLQKRNLPTNTPVTALRVGHDNRIAAAGPDHAMQILVGPITAPLWTWIVLLFGVFGSAFHLNSLRTLTQPVVSPTALESDEPTSVVNNLPSSILELVTVLESLLGNRGTAGPLTLCVDGPWGSGKSSLVTVLCRKLREQYCTCVFFNAWHHEDENRLFTALMEQIRQSWVPRGTPNWPGTPVDPLPLAQRLWLPFEIALFYSGMWRKRFAEAWKSRSLFIGIFLFTSILFFLSLYSSTRLLLATIFPTFEPFSDPYRYSLFLITFLSASFAASIFLWNSRWNFLRPFPVTPVSLVTASNGWLQFTQPSDQLSFRYQFQQSFREVCAALDRSSRRLVIFIDDLDRCEPSHVVDTLEAVNFLTSCGPCFVVLAMEKDRIKTLLSARTEEATQTLSDSASVDRYLEKLINVTVRIPPTTTAELRTVRRPQ